MTRFPRLFVTLSLLLLSSADIATAMTVYMNDGSEMEAQSAWQDGEKVYVRINRDLSLEFPVSEVNLRQSRIQRESHAKTAPSQKGATWPELGRSSGVVDELIVVAGHRRDFYDLFGRSGHDGIDEIFKKTYSPAMAEKTMRNALERRLTQRELAVVLDWYKGPVGRKIVEADSIWDFNRRDKSRAYARTDAGPAFKERLNLTTQIEKVAGTSELETRLTKNLMLRMINLIPADFLDAKQIKEWLKTEIPTVEKRRKDNIEKWAYTYRHLSMEELRDYLRFLRSNTGRKYMATVQEASEEMIRKVSANIEKDFKNDVTMLMK